MHELIDNVFFFISIFYSLSTDCAHSSLRPKCGHI